MVLKEMPELFDVEESVTDPVPPELPKTMDVKEVPKVATWVCDPVTNN